MMKIIVAILFSFSSVCFAQGNLQFNQVRFIKAADGSQTIPAGKVWKIESVYSFSDSSPYAISTSGTTTSAFAICGVGSVWLQYYTENMVINGDFVPFGTVGGEARTQLPFWLPAGSTVCIVNNSTFSAAGYSVVEFNIVP